MVSRIKESLAAKLIEVYPQANVYDEFIAQRLQKGGFFIDIVEQDYSKLIGTANQSKVIVDLSYFPKGNKEGIRSEIDDVKSMLLRELDAIRGFRIIEKTATVVDDVLHIQMTIYYRELKVIDQVKMNTMSQNTKSKE